ncbi:MAG: sugar ABC transporter ATP-binding protein [Verrucomicrobiales bacterium]|nr:sugar ABC transporter ATP-binding protein [Verrucomicrobiales bacterium]
MCPHLLHLLFAGEPLGALGVLQADGTQDCRVDHLTGPCRSGQRCCLLVQWTNRKSWPWIRQPPPTGALSGWTAAGDWGKRQGVTDLPTDSQSQSQTAAPILEGRGIVKQFPGVKALRGVGLRVQRGEVLALLGENGAGKSTLMKILAGVQTPDAGEILLDGRAVVIDSVPTAMRHGIALIHQELNLATNLSIGANIFLGREPRRHGFIDEKTIVAESRRFLDLVGLQIDPREVVGNLTIGRQQMVEIAKALSIDARILIMDEPTSSLSQKETESLFAVIRDLRSRGVSIIYISHRLGEVKALADRVTVLRDGENAGDLARDEISHDRMVSLMVGRDLSQFYPHQPHTPGDVVLEVRGLRTPVHPGHELSFSLRAGEIVGVAGLVGAGRTEMIETLFGAMPAVAGDIRIAGESVAIRSPRDAIRAGLALAPEDRKRQGLVLEMAVRENLSLASLSRDRRPGGFLNRRRESEISAEMIGKMRIKTPNDRQVVRYLSGGNQQKVVLGKWLAMKPRVLLLDEPTRGIDVGAKQEIYALMEDLARAGVAILFVSSEMEEVLGMSDRALVMHEGRLTGELARDRLSEEAVMRLATGGDSPAAAA